MINKVISMDSRDAKRNTKLGKIKLSKLKLKHLKINDTNHYAIGGIK